MSVVIVDRDGFRILKVTGFLDGRTRESREILEYLSVAPTEIETHQVLDLSAVEYVNSSTLGHFVRFLSTAQSRNFMVLILNPPPSVRNVLELTGLSHVLPIIKTEAEIAARLGAEAAQRLPDGEVDYDALADEIESFMLRGDPPAVTPDSELGRVTGS